MKLAPILAEYLYQNKRLELPGIGVFHLNQSIVSEEGDHKHIKFTGESPISFESNTSVKESPGLINFISSQTGKMKALAAADLDSHLELAHQFINIGKPFLFEGIGSLIKTKSGQYEFSSGLVTNEKIIVCKGKVISMTSSTEDSFTEYNNIFSPKKIKINWQRPAIFGLIVIGIALAIWGGYSISKRRASKNIVANTTEIQKPKEEQKMVPTDPIDTAAIAKKERGLHRYDMLKGFGLDVQMETKDSIDYKLFFLLPAASKDTSRILDSLRYLYTPYWSKSFVEN